MSSKNGPKTELIPPFSPPGSHAYSTLNPPSSHEGGLRVEYARKKEGEKDKRASFSLSSDSKPPSVHDSCTLFH
jgi:hypothetical protein